jgi:hypothetical protein
MDYLLSKKDKIEAFEKAKNKPMFFEMIITIIMKYFTSSKRSLPSFYRNHGTLRFVMESKPRVFFCCNRKA